MITNLNTIYDLAHEIPERLQYYNKYTWLAYNKIIECRYLDINDAMTLDLSLNSYISEMGVILLFPNRIGTTITDVFIRGINTKDMPLKLGSNHFPFNIGNLKEDFKFGDTIILVEGVTDIGGLKVISPDINVISLQSNSISTEHLQLLTQITDNFILLLDSDSAGIKGANITKRKLEKEGAKVKIVEQYGKLKDTGDIVDILMTYLKSDKHSEEIKARLQLISSYYKLQLKLKEDKNETTN